MHFSGMPLLSELGIAPPDFHAPLGVCRLAANLGRPGLAKLGDEARDFSLSELPLVHTTHDARLGAV